MTDFTVSGTEEAIAYLEEIAREMLLLSPITISEARGRFNREFEARAFLTAIEVNILLHEEQDVWAKHIYYGRESCWWLDEEGAKPRPYP